MGLMEFQRAQSDITRTPDEKQTEDQLFKELRTIKNTLENTKLLAYHAIGTNIVKFYGKSYGDDEMGRIAKELDLARSTVYKICQFANKYDQDAVDKISGGSFRFLSKSH